MSYFKILCIFGLRWLEQEKSTDSPYLVKVTIYG